MLLIVLHVFVFRLLSVRMCVSYSPDVCLCVLFAYVFRYGPSFRVLSIYYCEFFKMCLR
ncbi:unknown [Prevotella sp. CAG:487]|nr:unknown [Prevotella sp. CAG:487]